MDDARQAIRDAGFDGWAAIHIADAISAPHADFLFPGEHQRLAEAVIAVLVTYDRPAAVASRIVTRIWNTVNNGVVTFQDVARFVINLCPIAAKVGQPIEPLLAMLAYHTQQGMTPDVVERHARESLQMLAAWVEGDE